MSNDLSVQIERERHFAVSRDALWRLISDTERLNRELKLPPVKYEFVPLAGGGSTLRGRVRFAGLTLHYSEEPYRWARPERFSVRRVFDNGPFQELSIAVELAEENGANDEPGTRARATCRVVGRGALTHQLARRFALASAEALIRAGAGFAAYLAGEQEAAYPRHAGRPPVHEERLAQAAARLKTLGASEAVAARLTDHVARAPAEDVLNLRPFDLADGWGFSRRDVLTVCLLCVRAGLLDLRWRVLCPACRAPGAGAAHLEDVTNGQAHCPACDIRFGPEFDRSVEVYFSVAPAVRPIPDASAVIYCMGGPGNTPHVVAQWPVEPGGETVLSLDLLPGRYALVSPQVAERRDVEVVPTAPPPPGAVGTSITLFPTRGGGNWLQVSTGGGDEDGNRLPCRGSWRVRSGLQTPAVLRLEAPNLVPDVCTAAFVTTLALFRDTFSSEVLSPGVELSVRQIAILFSDLKGSTGLYRDRGDAPSYAVVRNHFSWVKTVLADHDGGVIKTLGDAVMAAFADPADALEAALDLQKHASDRPDALVVKIGLHAGPALAVTANGVLDYFGQTVNVAARLNKESVGGDVVLAQSLAADPRVAAALEENGARNGLHAQAFAAVLRGANDEPTPLLRLTWQPTETNQP